MALAPYFAKAALAASGVIRGLDYTRLASRLEGLQVGVLLGSDAGGPEGRVTAELLVNLLARFYPRIGISESESGKSAYTRELIALARRTNPDIEVTHGVHEATVVAVVGGARPPDKIPAVYLGSSGWVARFSPGEPQGCDSSTNPLGAAAAACFGAANVFRSVFADVLKQSEIDSSFSLSLADPGPSKSPTSNPSTESADIGQTHLVGVGAIGSATAWVLARFPGLRGTLHLIDPQTVDDTTPQRYELAFPDQVGTPKVQLAAAGFRSSAVSAIPHQRDWAGYLHESGDWSLQRVAVALDTAEDRIGVQSSLPKRILNAWTNPGDLGVSRHLSFGNGPCLACLYLGNAGPKSKDQLVAESIGLPGELMAVRKMLYLATPLDDAFLGRIAAANRLPPENLLGFRGRSLDEFYSQAVCGGLLLQESGRPDSAPAEVPLAFQSALAGVLLAAEVVADAAGMRIGALPPLTRINVLHPLGEYLSPPRERDATGKCLCADPDFLRAYQAKYP